MFLRSLTTEVMGIGPSADGGSVHRALLYVTLYNRFLIFASKGKNIILY